MIRAIRNIGLWFVFGTLAAAGCATTAGGHGGGHDVHSSARIPGDGARVLVSGPAWLLHVDVEGRDDLSLYAVARKAGTDADCTSGAVVEKKRLHPGQSNLVNLSVAADETICVGAPSQDADGVGDVACAPDRQRRDRRSGAGAGVRGGWSIARSRRRAVARITVR